MSLNNCLVVKFLASDSTVVSSRSLIHIQRTRRAIRVKLFEVTMSPYCGSV